MQTHKICSWTAVFLTSGIVAASAATAPESGATYTLSANLTKNEPRLAIVNGLPTAEQLPVQAGTNGLVYTDGAGKIDGVQDVLLRLPGPMSNGVYVADVSGSVSMNKSNVPAVRMTLKGSGYAWGTPAGAQTNSNFTLTFTGTATRQEQTVAVFDGTDVSRIVVNSDGTTNYTIVDTNLYKTAEWRAEGYNEVKVTYHYSETTSELKNGTNVVKIKNKIATEKVAVGLPASASVSNTLNAPHSTRTFPNVHVSTEFEGGVTNLVYGLDSTNLQSYLDSYAISNAGFIQVVASVEVDRQGDYYKSNPIVYVNDIEAMAGRLKGTIRAGKTTWKIDQPATLTAPYTLYTAISNAAAIYEQSIPGAGLVMDTRGRLNALVVQQGNHLWTTGPSTPSPDADDDSFSGKGTLDPRRSTYKATLKGVAFNRGSQLSLNGTNGLLLRYEVDTNLPPVVVTVTNLASTNLLSVSVTNGTLATIEPTVITNYPPVLLDAATVLNVVGDFDEVKVPPPIRTNAVPNAIKTVVLSGKLLGQKFSNVKGENADDDYPGN